MLRSAKIEWTARKLYKMTQRNEITFDNAVQRGLVWHNKKKSLLIHSMLSGYPIPPFYAAKNGDRYDMLDGKQRINAIADFIVGKFELEGIPEVESPNDDGTADMVDINTLHFDELEESLREELQDYSLTAYYFDSITDEEISEMFFRLNNGKALSAVELTRVRAKSMSTIKEIAQHEIFNSALTKKALEKYTNEDIVIKTYVILHDEEPSMETKYIRPLMESIEITDADREQIWKIYDRILAMHKLIADKKIAKRILVRTHLITMVPVIWKSIQDGRTDQQMAGWASEFFNGKRSATISLAYNMSAGSGSAKKESVRKRLKEITENYERYFMGREKKEDISNERCVCIE